MKLLERKPVFSTSSTRIDTLVRKIEGFQLEIAEHRRKLDKTRDQLRDSDLRYQELYELSPVAFLALDKQARITAINSQGASLLGFHSSWLMGRPFLVFIATDDIKAFLKFLSRSTRTQHQENLEVTLNVNGHCFPVHISMKSAKFGRSLVHRMTIVDLSDVKKNERRLSASLDRWLTVVKSAPDVMVTVDSKGNILFANRSLWGHSPESLVHSQILDYIPEPERPGLSECLNEVFASGKPRACEIPGAGGLANSWHEFTFGSVEQPDLTDGQTTTILIRDISEEKNAQEKLRMSGEQLREFAAKIETIREEERRRVAREIHDQLGQALTVTKLDLSWLQSKPPRNQREFRKRVKSMMAHVDDTIDRMRKIVSDLRPSVLDDLGLVPAIEWETKEFQKRTGIPTRLRSNVEDARISQERSAEVFRAVQEALTNVTRHARAKSVEVVLKAEKGLIKISVSDDGQGMKDDVIKNFKSLGITGMRERISRIGGDFNIHSIPGSGTRVEIVLGI
jgi:PAS domain S-box-containing protein